MATHVLSRARCRQQQMTAQGPSQKCKWWRAIVHLKTMNILVTVRSNQRANFAAAMARLVSKSAVKRNNLLRHHVDQTSMPLASCRGIMRTTSENKTAQNGRTSQPCTFRCHRSHTASTGWWLSDRDHCSCGCCVDLWLACMCPNILSAIDVRPACPSMHQQ